MTKICCVCQRIEHGTYWKNEDEYQFAANERVTHGYCPLCFDVVMSDLMEYIEGNTSEADDMRIASDICSQVSSCA